MRKIRRRIYVLNMCEVTTENFYKIYPQVIGDLHSSSFISVDCEFSGLFEANFQCSLFDTPKERFQKLQDSLKNFQIVQFGLSTFKYERDNNSFISSSYTFYLKPSTGFGNQKLSFLPESLDFLCKHQFDFNKLFYKGINYVNESYEAEVLKQIEAGVISEESAREIQKFCSRVAEWWGNAFEGEEIILETSENSKTFIYTLHQEIRKRFANCWTYFGEDDVVKVRKIIEIEKQSLLANKKEEVYLKKKIFDSILGFSRIIKEIKNLKKPVVGHNFLLDLILIYKQFFNPCPTTYRDFKKAITDIFPCVYDTKSVSFKLREIVPRDFTWNTNMLSDLYEYLKRGKGATLVIFTPLVYHRNEDFVKGGHLHEAGFDSYCTGFCFLKMAHIFSLWDKETRKFSLTSMPTSSSWLLGAVEGMRNQVNVSRGQVNHIVLDGDDPKSVRPGLLYVESRNNQPLHVFKIRELISKYGSVDIKLRSKFKGIMAVATKKQLQDILDRFKDHKEYKITKYKFLFHTDTGKFIISSTLIASVAMVAIFTSKGWTKL